MNQDEPRYKLPKGRVWNMQDWLPRLGANLRKRGGTADYSADISAAASSATYVDTVGYAPFISGPLVLAMTDNSKFVKVSSAGTVTQVSASGVTCVQPPVFFTEKAIFPVGDGTTSPKYYDGSTFGALGGSPPAGKYAVVWKNFLAVGGATATPRRVYWSELTDPTTWDTSQGWLDVSQPMTGFAALPNVLLVFQEKVTTRIRGSIAPPGGDFAVDDPIFAIGCTDARSIAVDGPSCCFANPTGVFLTNGTVSVEDLTASCGLKKHWQTNMASYSSSWTIAGGFYRHLYYVTIMNGSTFVDSYVFDPIDRKAWRNTNFKHRMYHPVQGLSEELLAASRSRPYVTKLSTTWTPGSSYKNDADGTAVTPVLETGFYDDLRGANQRIRDVFVRYDLRDAASDNPILTVSYATTPDGSYTALSQTLAETSDEDRVQMPVRKTGRGFSLKFAQTNASSETKLVALEATVRDWEASR